MRCWRPVAQKQARRPGCMMWFTQLRDIYGEEKGPNSMGEGQRTINTMKMMLAGHLAVRATPADKEEASSLWQSLVDTAIASAGASSRHAELSCPAHAFLDRARGSFPPSELRCDTFWSCHPPPLHTHPLAGRTPPRAALRRTSHPFPSHTPTHPTAIAGQEEDPSVADAMFRQGNLLMRFQDYPGAVKATRRAVEILEATIPANHHRVTLVKPIEALILALEVTMARVLPTHSFAETPPFPCDVAF